MSDEITGAAIQASGTILAAIFAVIAAYFGLHQWRKEAPGRRIIELTEECLTLASKLTVRQSVFRDIMGLAYKTEEDIREEIAESVAEAKILAEKCRTLELYLGPYPAKVASFIFWYNYVNESDLKDFQKIVSSLGEDDTKKEEVRRDFSVVEAKKLILPDILYQNLFNFLQPYLLGKSPKFNHEKKILELKEIFDNNTKPYFWLSDKSLITEEIPSR